MHEINKDRFGEDEDQAESAIVKLLVEEDLIDEEDFDDDKIEYHPISS